MLGSPGITVEYAPPLWVATSVTPTNITDWLDSYSHTITAEYGYDKATLRMKLPADTARTIYGRWLGGDIKVYNHALAVCWEGFVDNIKLEQGALSTSKGPYLEIRNNIAVQYQTRRYNTTPPIGGQTTTTTYASNATSQLRFGTLTAVIEGGESDATRADYIRDTALDEMAWPQGDDTLQLNGGSDVTIVLELRGYAHLLDTYYYNNTAVTGTQNASAKITAVLGDSPNVTFSTVRVDTNTYPVQQYENDNATAWTVIKATVAPGDASGNRWLFGVYANQQARYRQRPSTARYVMDVTESQLYTYPGNGRVYPWDVQAGEWVEIANAETVYTSPHSNLQTSDNARFIESVTYTAPYGLQVNGRRISTLAQLLAQGKR